MTTKLETIVSTLSTAVEAITPDVLPSVLFLRYHGSKSVEEAQGPYRARAFQFRAGDPQQERTVSCSAAVWQRMTLLLEIGYVFSAPAYNDTVGYGVDWVALADQKQLKRTLFFLNPLAAVSNVKRLLWLGPERPTDKMRVYRFDLEWAE